MQPSRHQLLRLRRVSLASGASLLFLLLCWSAHAAGYLGLSLVGMLVLTGLVGLSCLAFLALVRSNLNLRFHDPSLTLPLMSWAICVIFATAYHAGELRLLFLMTVLLVLMFGTFRLQLRGFLLVILLTAVCYALLISSLVASGRELDLHSEAIQAVEFFVLLTGVGLLSLEMNGLRRSLVQRNNDLRMALESIQKLAITDELTGLYNRRFTKDILAQQKALADRGDYGFVLCLVDLDYFKNVNDRYGHGCGDAVLRQLSKMLQDSVRDVDFVARLGGEEFLLVLSRTNEAGAEVMLERLQAKVRAAHWDQCPGLKLTLSLGVSAYRPGESWEDSLLRVDMALYEAKHSGRDQLAVL
ncbi:GGDEF domain-containing protein [Pseudomonas sp. No.21]|jgi:diguanylate cyclase (GGDEF)-like protein|uniref:GGDEF domain-containing protein n=1 Tax=Pseudomonas tohonis TaxID=2725477 RepID=UPI001F3C6644|nr:GGDEF domain-containing protein [Pseudomonas tohonis]GJN45088.1 hypothetical protein TUM20249_10740 [Pseudomonas tohonis]